MIPFGSFSSLTFTRVDEVDLSYHGQGIVSQLKIEKINKLINKLIKGIEERPGRGSPAGGTAQSGPADPADPAPASSAAGCSRPVAADVTSSSLIRSHCSCILDLVLVCPIEGRPAEGPSKMLDMYNIASFFYLLCTSFNHPCMQHLSFPSPNTLTHGRCDPDERIVIYRFRALCCAAAVLHCAAMEVGDWATLL